MPFVATIIASPDNPAITAKLLDRIGSALPIRRSDWLHQGFAVDLVLSAEIGLSEIAKVLGQILSAEPVDWAVQEPQQRRKKALVADMDSTMIDQECIDELADEAGFGERVAAITERAMNGELDFEPALRERVALLAGLQQHVIERVLSERITLAPGAKTLISTLRANGVYTALVSGGFTRFTGPIAKELGFDEHQANELLATESALTGEVREPILGQDAKREALVRIASMLGIAPADIMAVGDGANDLQMLMLAGSGVALHAKPAVARQAKLRIDHGDLTALLFLQGYAKADFH